MSENRKLWNLWIGPSYTSRVKRFDNQRAVNFYPEIDEFTGSGQPSPGKNQQVAAYIGTPGTLRVNTLGNGPVRGMHEVSNQNLAYIVSGNQVFQMSSANSIPIPLNGNLATSSGPVSIADNGVQVIIVDGPSGGGYYYTLGDSTLTLHTITSANFYPADTVTFQDGYFILNRSGTTDFFISDLYTVNFLPLNVSAKTGNSDILIAVNSLNRQLTLLGQRTIEWWWDAGQSGSSPFQRQDGRFSQYGCIAPASIQVVAENLIYLSSNSQGGGMVMQLSAGGQPTRISTHAIDYLIQNAGDLSASTAFSYQDEGHIFYCLNVPGLNTTLVYDTATNLWHERQSSINGNIGRHLVNCHVYLDNQHLVGDYSNGNLYVYDFNTYTDNGQMLPHIRQSPHFSVTGNYCFYYMMEIDFQFGVGVVNNGTNAQSDVTPLAVLEVSDDGGQTWGLPIYGEMGEIGQYKTRCRFYNLGYGRDVVFKLTVTNAVEVQMLSCIMNFKEGNQ